jgi:hypothetical protein
MLRDSLLHGSGSSGVILRQLGLPCVRRGEKVFEKSGQRRGGRFLPDAETRTVVEGPGATPSLQFVPDFPDAEFLGADVDIVKQKNSGRAQLREPGIDIMPNGRFGMQAVDVEHIDYAGLELFKGIIEAGADECGELCVVRVVVLGNLGEGRLVVTAGLLIAAPGIDPEAAGASLVFRG